MPSISGTIFIFLFFSFFPPSVFSLLYILELGEGVTGFYRAENKEYHGGYFPHNYVIHV